MIVTPSNPFESTRVRDNNLLLPSFVAISRKARIMARGSSSIPTSFTKTTKAMITYVMLRKVFKNELIHRIFMQMDV
jgi:hypothetical protein